MQNEGSLRQISRRKFVKISAGVLCAWTTGACLSDYINSAKAAAGIYQRIVILSDVHVPSARDAEKINALRQINEWSDVHHVVTLGDMSVDNGDEAQLTAAVKLMSNLKQRNVMVAGNHDYIYSDKLNAEGKKVQGTPAERAFKLRRFQKAFGMEKGFFSENAGRYHLVYLSTDDLESKYSTTLSAAQLAWLEDDLKANKEKATIIFFHGPLEGTTQVKNPKKLLKSIAQPTDKIRAILTANPQAFMWVAGHLHLGEYHPDSKTAEKYTYHCNKEGSAGHNVINIHNPALKGTGPWREKTGKNDKEYKLYPTLWTNSLYLYDDEIVVKVFDHGAGREVAELERHIESWRKH